GRCRCPLRLRASDLSWPMAKRRSAKSLASNRRRRAKIHSASRLGLTLVDPSFRHMPLIFADPPPPETPLRAAIRDAHRQDETAADARILAAADMPLEARERITATARRLVDTVRRERLRKGGRDAFL